MRALAPAASALLLSVCAAMAQGGSQIALSAVFAGENKPVPHGLVWRVYSLATPGEPRLVAQSEEPRPALPVPSGEYVVHVSYGLASATRNVFVGAGVTTERVPIAAGAIKVRGSILDQPIPPDRLQISVFIPLPGSSEGRLVRAGLPVGEVLRLPEGAYHVVSTYGGTNSIVRADLRVQSGRLTEADMRHRAATVTLKLVSYVGGEARANTAWSVLTPGGDVIREALGAFPSVTLAEGEYVAIARNDGQVFTSNFRVRAGLDRDVEVVARDPAPANGDPSTAGPSRPPTSAPFPTPKR